MEVMDETEAERLDSRRNYDNYRWVAIGGIGRADGAIFHERVRHNRRWIAAKCEGIRMNPVET